MKDMRKKLGMVQIYEVRFVDCQHNRQLGDPVVDDIIFGRLLSMQRIGNMQFAVDYLLKKEGPFPSKEVIGSQDRIR